MKMTAELTKCDIELGTLGPDCWTIMPIKDSLKKKEKCVVTTTKITDICKRVEKETNIPKNHIVEVYKNSRKKSGEDSYCHQIWSLPLYSARRSITGIF